ncbi:MAG: alpha-acetolactate decarboxylase [Conexibacter sp.]|nr:alpha-acetolactate decarboxylase [Conexibacter sp.]
MAIDPRLVQALHLRTVRHAALTDELAAHVAFQTSTLEALFDGSFDGDLTVGELRRHGDLGLGTFDALDGEMIVVDGEVWRAHADGSVVRAGDDERTPFAVVTSFAADVTLALAEPLDQEALLRAIGDAAGGIDATYAIRFDGALGLVRARSVPRQQMPYPTLVEAAASQCEFTLGPAEGTLVGFAFPSWAGGVELPGFHLHAITADRRRGGHVLEAQVGPGTLQLAVLTDLHMELPPGVELPDGAPESTRAQALAQIEGGGR